MIFEFRRHIHLLLLGSHITLLSTRVNILQVCLLCRFSVFESKISLLHNFIPQVIKYGKVPVDICSLEMITTRSLLFVFRNLNDYSWRELDLINYVTSEIMFGKINGKSKKLAMSKMLKNGMNILDIMLKSCQKY